MDQISDAIRAFILTEFLPGERPEDLTGDTPLITGGILDSLATIKLVSFLEEQYGVTFQAYETDVDHFNTVSDITSLVLSKLGPGRAR